MKVSFSSPAARKLWRETLKQYELGAHEKLILRGACTALDKVEQIQDALADAELLARGSMGQVVANPLLGEQRVQQAAFDRAIKQLDLPEEEGSAGRDAQSRSASARAAANARWNM